MMNSRTVKTKHLIQGLIAAGAALLVVSCHPNRPNVPATQTVWEGTSYNRTTSSGHNARLILNTYKGHEYIDGSYCDYGNLWGPGSLNNDGATCEIEGYRKGNYVKFVTIPSALERGVASAFTGKNLATVPDTIHKTNHNMGAGSTLYQGWISGRNMNLSWDSYPSAADMQKYSRCPAHQFGSSSLKRQ